MNHENIVRYEEQFSSKYLFNKSQLIYYYCNVVLLNGQSLNSSS